MSEEITPVARPCMNPENMGLAEAVNRFRYTLETTARRLGDIERVIRLSPDRYGDDVKERMAMVAADLADESKRHAQEIREAV